MLPACGPFRRSERPACARTTIDHDLPMFSAAAVYLIARPVHLTAVGLSLLFFLVRGSAVLAGASWPLARWARRTSVLIDSVLLLAGVSLWAVLTLNPLGPDYWLGTKLLLLLAYIGIGSLALRRARSPRTRAVAFALALVCAAAMVGVALAHHQAGWWLIWRRA